MTGVVERAGAAVPRRADSDRSSRWVARLAGLFCLCGVVFSSTASGRPVTYRAVVRWTAHDIPHVKADDFAGLGFGAGYAYARLNRCLLMETVMTVRGERSRFIGPDRPAGPGGRAGSNLESDMFFRFYFDMDRLGHGYRRQKDVWRLLSGYAAGVDLALSKPAAPRPCGGARLAGPVTVDDVIRMIAQKAVFDTALPLYPQMVRAAPPGVATVKGAVPDPVPPVPAAHGEKEGSNAYALGAAVTEGKTGLLVGNPHFPWDGPNRFFEMHLTIPGRLDVMGAALGGLPMINIGFNRDVAWSHTVSTDRRFTFFRLALVPGHPDRYVVDGRPEAMTRRVVEIPVLTPGGATEIRRRVIYESRYGPLVSIERRGMRWTDTEAYALADSERRNTRMIAQWLRIDRAVSAADLLAGLKAVRGLPWVNTIAADRLGQALYADESIVPDLPDDADPSCFVGGRSPEGVPVMDGARSACDWTRRGVLPARDMPVARTTRYVFNSNNSPWITGAEPGSSSVPEIVGGKGTPLGLRARMSLVSLRRLTAAGPVSLDQAEHMILDSRNYAAELAAPALAALCGTEPHDRPVSAEACRVLLAWDRTDRPDSRGAVLFRAFWTRAHEIPDLWRVPFDPDAPADTPCGIAFARASVHTALRQALEGAVDELTRFHIPLSAPLSRVQYRATGAGGIPVPGGSGMEGILNVVGFGALGGAGYANENIMGTSYLLAVTWKKGRPVADALLTYGQSDDPLLPAYADQTDLFSMGRMVRLPFEESAIRQDPSFAIEEVRQ